MGNFNYFFPLLNAFAMRDGIVLGATGLVSFAAVLLSAPYGVGGMLLVASLIAWLCVLYYCGRRRMLLESGQGRAWHFGRSYVHALLSQLYGSAWVALAVYVWFRFFDKGFFIGSMIAFLKRPDMQQYISEMEGRGLFEDMYRATGAEGIFGVFEALLHVPPETYSSMVVSWTLMAAPVVALLIALVNRRV